MSHWSKVVDEAAEKARQGTPATIRVTGQADLMFVNMECNRHADLAKSFDTSTGTITLSKREG